MSVSESRDRNRIVFQGPAASVRLGYQRAAALGAWRIEGDRLEAAVLDVDAFRMSQSGLVLEIQNKDGAPTRRALSAVTVQAGRLEGRLSRLEHS